MSSLGVLAPLLLALLLSVALCPRSADATVGVAGTPPMGWNSWNTFGCAGISDATVRMTADSFISFGLRDAGYEYVNMDDCWMLKDRADSGAGPQIPNPDKFPNGLQQVIDYVHGKGLKFGLYTARASNTCAGFAASCRHEAVDAQQYANWSVDYLKDDSCGGCRDVLEDYRIMQASIDATGHKIVLSVEGQPDVPTVSKGGHGNMRRVGHDISANWISMTSLIDQGSGLYPYAHNDSGTGGWWNDLDMLELGNGDFNADASPAQLQMARAHMGMWCIMKAPLLLGNDLSKMGPLTLATVTNRAALAVNQDAWGVQARRVASTPSPDARIVQSYTGQVILARCNASPTQTWRLRAAPLLRNNVFVGKCNASDPYQQWASVGSAPGPLRNAGNGQCVDDTLQSDPAQTGPCQSKASQQYHLDAAQHLVSVRNTCLDVYNFQGPDVEIYGCKQGGASDENQRWQYNASTGQITSFSPALHADANCLMVGGAQGEYQLYTNDAQGNEWCMSCGYLDGGGCTVGPCSDGHTFRVSLHGDTTRSGPQPFSFLWNGEGVGWSTDFGASGPVPHSRYLGGGNWPWVLDLQKALGGAGSTISPKAGQSIIDDDNIGHVTSSPSDSFCLDLSPASSLEVWAGPLSGGRQALALFNRSPSPQNITAAFSAFTSAPALALYDVWNNKPLGTYRGSYTGLTPAFGVTLLVGSQP